MLCFTTVGGVIKWTTWHSSLLPSSCVPFTTFQVFYAEWDTCKSNIHASEMWGGGRIENILVFWKEGALGALFFTYSAVITDIEIWAIPAETAGNGKDNV